VLFLVLLVISYIAIIALDADEYYTMPRMFPIAKGLVLPASDDSKAAVEYSRLCPLTSIKQAKILLDCNFGAEPAPPRTCLFLR